MEQFYEELETICAQLGAAALPRWDELPDLEIYMDQLLSVISRYLKDYFGPEDKGLTASMVNNYVKLGIIPAPTKKKYNREHIAQLIIICVMKNSLPISIVRKQIDSELSLGKSCEHVYNRFCDYFERITSEVAETAITMKNETNELSRAVLSASLRAQAEQNLVMRLLSCAPKEEKSSKGHSRKKE